MPSKSKNNIRPLLSKYTPLKGTYDEYFQTKGNARQGLGGLTRLLDEFGETEFRLRQKLADEWAARIVPIVITFAVLTYFAWSLKKAFHLGLICKI